MLSKPKRGSPDLRETRMDWLATQGHAIVLFVYNPHQHPRNLDGKLHNQEETKREQAEKLDVMGPSRRVGSCLRLVNCTVLRPWLANHSEAAVCHS